MMCAKAKKKVLVLGGAGTMGAPLCRFLVELGYEVSATSRQKREASNGVCYCHGNAQNKDFLMPLLHQEKPDAIVDFMDYDTGTFSHQVELLLSNCKHYLFLSSYRVYADSSELNEDAPRLLDRCLDRDYLSTDEYALHKARSEDLLLQSNHKNWTILRPGIIYSNGCFKFGCLEAHTVMFRAMQKLPVVIPFQMLEKKTTLTWADDAAYLISRLVLNPKAYLNIYNVSSGEPSTWADVARIYESSIGMEIHDVPLDVYCRICNRYQVMYDRMYNRSLINEKILRDTGISLHELTSMAVGLRRQILAFCANPRLKKIDIFQNAIIDKVCSTRVAFDEFSLKEVIQYYGFKNVFLSQMFSTYRFVRKLFHTLRK